MGETRSDALRRRAATCLAAMLVLPSAFFFSTASAEDEVVNVICTNSALADFAENVFGEELESSVSVEYIMPAGVCPSHFDTSPSDVVAIASADVVISLGWEPWLPDLLDASGNDDAYQITCMDLGEWNIPSGAAAHIAMIADGLTEFAPDWADIFEGNAANYSALIEESYESARLQIESLGLNGTKVVTIDWYSAFLTGLGFEVVASYGAPESLSTNDIMEVTAKCDDSEVSMVVDNLQSTIDFGANLASEFGKEHVILSNFPGAIPGKYTYLDNMAYNMGELTNAAQAYKETQNEITELESEVSSLEFQRIALLSAVAVLTALLLLSIVISRRKTV